jgi:phosphoribosylamine--glycine ligase
MKVLVIGNGGREHAIIWKLSQSSKVSKIYCTIGNAGINKIAEPVNITHDNIFGLLDFVKKNGIELTVVGPEIPLSLGITDAFEKEDLKIFGPSQKAALLETSKVYAKNFMKKYGIPTAAYEVFNPNEKVKLTEYLNRIKYPAVIKVDGLAAGKGVLICKDVKESLAAVNDIFDNKIFGSAGDKIVVEEYLAGIEASVFVVCDGKDYIILPPAQDHKKILDNEQGKNTGGMGSFAPADNIVTAELMEKVKSSIIEPVLGNMVNEGIPYKGCLYVGLMISENKEPFVIEFNVRLGDPETQVVLPMIRSDIFDMMYASAAGNIKDYKLETDSSYYCLVVMASSGYPDKYDSGKIITGIENIEDKDILIFHAGTKTDAHDNTVSCGGRVLNVVGHSDKGLKEAIDKVYSFIPNVDFENKYYRSDIGLKGLKVKQ